MTLPIIGSIPIVDPVDVTILDSSTRTPVAVLRFDFNDQEAWHCLRVFADILDKDNQGQ